MKPNRLLLVLASLLLLSVSAPLAATAQRTTVVIRTAPPAPRVERVVVRRGYVYRGGYWRWSGHRYVWVSGRYYRARPGRTVWVAGHYAQRPGGWVYVPGHWR